MHENHHPPQRSSAAPQPLATLDGFVHYASRSVPVHHPVPASQLLLGRSDPAAPDHPLKPLYPAVHLGLGLSTKLSRLHARINYDRASRSFTLTCLGRNPVLLTPAPRARELRITDKEPHPLPDGAAIKIADSRLVFRLLEQQPQSADAPPACESPSPVSPPKKRKRREWIKSEHSSLRTLMMRYGYGRWEKILSETNSRLAERQPEELVPVARTFIARCYLHARPGVEQKALMDILRRHPVQLFDNREHDVEHEINQLLEHARTQIEPKEKRKFVRWARKLRLLSRLQDVHDHSSLQRLRAGELRVATPPPALYWTSNDDADFIIGSYKHGYGAIEAIRQDPELGFLNRYAPAMSTKKTVTPVKSESLAPSANTDAAHMDMDDDDDDDENDHDPDKDEDDRHGLSMNEDVDDEDMHEFPLHNPKKRPKLGHTEPSSAQKDNAQLPLTGPSAGSASAQQSFVNTPHSQDDSDMSPLDPNPIEAVTAAVQSSLNTHENGSHGAKGSVKDESASGTEKTKRKRFVPKRGPRIGNQYGFNNPEDAAAAAKSMANDDGLVPFPNSEALMKRLKSTINSCAKEFDKDMRELKKKQMAESKAKQRKDDLAARKAEKEAEKTRRKAERRIRKSQPFSKKEALEFERALSNCGVVYKEDGKSVDWSWFHSKVQGFEAKYPETLDDAYVELLSEAHLSNDLSAAKEDEDFERVDNLNQRKNSATVFSTLTTERAEKLIERLEFFRALRGEVLVHPRLKSILRGFKKTRDLPSWWKGPDDRSLLIGVDRYGFNGWDNMCNDPDLTFASSMKSWQRKAANDLKSVKRPAMPKPSAATKRAFALLRYFRTRANDPHFEIYARNGASASQYGSERTASGGGAYSTNGALRGGKAKSEAKEEFVLEDDRPLMDLVRSREVGRKRAESAAPPPASSGRPRTERRTLIEIPKDEHGILILPADLGDGLFLLCLGEVVQGASAFCKNKVIYPVGFRTIRVVSGMALLCEIMGNEDRTRPVFRISVLDGFNEKASDEDTMWTGQREIGSGPNVVTLWMKVVNEHMSKDHQADNRVHLTSGPERFGLYEPTIVYHMQKLAGAKFIEGYVLRDFSKRGKGQYVEASVGLLEAMLNALDPKLNRRVSRRAYDATLTDEEEDAREHPVLAAGSEMSIPEDWKKLHHEGKRKQRRRCNSYYR
ncbi:chromo domain containing protein [Gracilaria domingensis]|nr:chromo domain containing protein [Gracilaria domingensis]